MDGDEDRYYGRVLNPTMTGPIPMSPMCLTLTGDVLPVRPLATASPEARRDAQELFGLLDASDLAIGNLEMPFTERGAPLEKLLNIRAVPEIANDLPAMGFDIVNLANNHTVDYGWVGLADTVHAVRATGLHPVGVGANLAEASEPVVLDVGGQRVGVLGMSCLLPTGMAATAQRPGLAPLHVETGYEVDPYYQMEEPGDPSCVRIRTRVRDADLRRAVNDVQRLRDRVDVLLVSVHWGYGSGEELAEYQQPLAHALIDAGADVIHGHHPHAVHAVGFHLGRPIFYSLGTFVGQQIFQPAPPAVQSLWGGMSPEGYVARLSFAEHGRTAIELVPTTLNTERLPVRATGSDFERIAARLARLSTSHGAEIRAQEGVLNASPRQPLAVEPVCAT